MADSTLSPAIASTLPRIRSPRGPVADDVAPQAPVQPPVTPLDPNVALFNSRRVRRAEAGGVCYFSASDIVLRLREVGRFPESPQVVAEQLLRGLGLPVRAVVFDEPAEGQEALAEPGVTRSEALRLVAGLDSHAARRVQAWMA